MKKITRLKKFDAWMRKINNVHYSSNAKMDEAYNRFEDDKRRVLKSA